MFDNIGEIVIMFWRTVRVLPETWRQRQKVFDQFFEIGNASLLMACILSLFIGGVLALQSGPVLAERGLANLIGGIVGNVWLEHIPEPLARQSLAGDWNGIALPGTTTMLMDQVKREFTPDPAMQGKRVLLYVETSANIVTGIILNDRMISRDFAGMHFLMDITPFVHWDRPNRLSLGSMYPTQPATVKTVELRYCEPSAL